MSEALLWVACGDKYVAEARVSAVYARRAMPDIARVLVTNKGVHDGVFTRVVVSPRKLDPWYLDSTRYHNLALDLPYDRISALDSDAYIVHPVYDLFEMLDRFDFMGVHEGPRRTARTVSPVPDPFAEFNIGVLAYRNNAVVKALFADWLNLYRGRVDVYGNNDQASLREAVWRARDLRIYVLSSEYNCRFHFGTWVSKEVKILHGRSGDLAKVERAENKRPGRMRAWRTRELRKDVIVEGYAT